MIMKDNFMKKTIAIMLAACAVFAFAGCSTVEHALLSANVTPGVTNAATGVVGLPVTNYAPNPVASAAAQTVAAMPFPFAGTAGVALGWMLTAYAAIKNRKLASALVSGIEAGRQILQTTPEGKALDSQVKDALISHQEAAGVLNAASALVNQLTGNTVKT